MAQGYTIVLISHYFNQIQFLTNNRHCDPDILASDAGTTLDPSGEGSIYNFVTEATRFKCVSSNPNLHSDVLVSVRLLQGEVQANDFLHATHIDKQKDIV
jgi:hypothetical protein